MGSNPATPTTRPRSRRTGAFVVSLLRAVLGGVVLTVLLYPVVLRSTSQPPPAPVTAG